MKFPRITKQFIENELYKLCAGYDTQRYMGKYSPKSKWQPQDIIKNVIRACLERTSIEDICSFNDGPSADTIHRRFSELSIHQVEQLVNSWLTEVTSRLKFHPNTKITLAFDLYFQRYYGNTKYEWVTGTGRKKGTNYAISFLIASIATGTVRCPVAVRLMTKKRMLEKAFLIGDILDELNLWLPVKRVLLDRGFCQTDVIEDLEARGLEFIIAAIRHGMVKTAAREIQTCVQELACQAGINSNDSVSLGQWSRKQGLDTFRVEHVFLKKRKTPVPLVAAFVRERFHHQNPLKRQRYQLYLYLTNIKASARTIVRLYGKRWLIETDIRCINDFKAVTNSIKPQTRLFLYGLAMVFDALWIVLSSFINHSRDYDFDTITDETQFLVKQCYRLACIARSFNRWLRLILRSELRFQGGDA
jgi:hypothetical protein